MAHALYTFLLPRPSPLTFVAHRGLWSRRFPRESNGVGWGGMGWDRFDADDPRIRPWYVAASSGPKDVVIVLDVSGSMSQYNRLDLAKEAAETVINTL